MKKIQHLLEYYLLRLWISFSMFIGLKAATRLTSLIVCYFGRMHKSSKIAYQNIKMIFPKLSDEQINKIIMQVWNNIAKLIVETPILYSYSQKQFESHVEITGLENIEHLKDKRVIFYTAHFANWEIISRALAPYGIKFSAVYRESNNKYIDKIIDDYRHKIDIEMIPKGKKGVKKIIRAIENNRNLVMLVDQRLDDGIKIPFMGVDAMTAPAIASLAIKYNCQLIGLQSIRLEGSKFKVVIHPQLKIHDLQVEEILLMINDQISGWIKAYPGLWFWLHQRWKMTKK